MRIIKNTFYVNAKVKTGYRYKDIFAIIPIANLNDLNERGTYFPCIIEIKYEGAEIDPLSKEFELAHSEAIKLGEFYSRRINQILSLLSVFTIYHFKGPIEDTVWYYDGANNKRVFPVYIQTNQTLDEKKFTEIKEKTEFTKEPDYLNSFQDKFILPENIDNLFDLFFASTDQFSEKYFKSIKLFHNGRNIYRESGSLAFAAFISSIETLSHYHFPENKTCPTCGQPQYSSTRKFKDFFLTFGEGKYLDKKFINNVYKWRSDILHTGELFIWELERTISIDNSSSKKHEEQNLELMKLYFYVRVALVNYLTREVKLK